MLGADFLQYSSSFRSILALGTDLVAVLPEQVRERNAGHGQEGGDGTGPMNAEVCVHVGGEQRERGTEQRTENRIGSEDRSSIEDVYE